MKKRLLWGLSLCLVLGLGACKSKESGYKKAYEAAQNKELAMAEEEIETPVVNETPAQTRPATNATFQKETLQAIEGDLKTFSVVIGSFRDRSNATRLKETYDAKGYKCSIALNTEKQMYRVIIGTFNTRLDATDLRDKVRSDYNLHDAWLLEKN